MDGDRYGRWQRVRVEPDVLGLTEVSRQRYPAVEFRMPQQATCPAAELPGWLDHHLIGKRGEAGRARGSSVGRAADIADLRKESSAI